MNYYYLIIPSVIIVLIAIGTGIFKTGKWVGSVNSDSATFKDFINEVRDDIKKILDRLPAKVVASGSPIRLTDLGNQVSEKIDAKNLAGEHAQKVFNKVKDSAPYEIQEYCMEYVKEESAWAPDQLKEFGNCAYENGIPLEQVFDVIAVELRDALLELIEKHSTPEMDQRNNEYTP